MIQTVTWKTVTKLTCADCAATLDRQVILCVTASKVASKGCPEQAGDQPYTYSTVEASICRYYRSSTITPPKWEYVFTYNDTQLVDGQLLTTADIFGVFCRSCFTQWVEELVGDEPYLVTEGDTNIIVSSHGCEYPFSAVVGDFNPDLEFIFGDGIDGDLVVPNGSTVYLPVARNFYFRNVTIEDGGTLLLVGIASTGAFGDEFQAYQMFVSGTLTLDGVIHADGTDAPDPVGSLNPDCSQTTFGGRTIGGGGDAGKNYTEDLTANTKIGYGPGGGYDFSGCGGRGASSTGAARSGKSNAGRVAAGLPFMGGGHAGAAGDGGAGGGVGAEGSYESCYSNPSIASCGGYPWPIPRFEPSLVSFGSGDSYVLGAICGGAGAGGGGGGTRGGVGTDAGGMGGGGGGPAGSIYIAARNIDIGVTGRISANGGDGGDGADGSIGTGVGGAGGGGGGGAGGGLVYLVYESLVNNGIIEANAGAGGAGGSGVGTLAVTGTGGDGEDGFPGNIYLLNMSTGLFDSV